MCWLACMRSRRPIAPKLAEFEKYLHETLDTVEVATKRRQLSGSRWAR